MNSSNAGELLASAAILTSKPGRIESACKMEIVGLNGQCHRVNVFDIDPTRDSYFIP